MRAAPRLVPVGARKPNQLAEARLRQAWRFVMGPALADRTRLLRVEREVLVIGCWELTRIAALREASLAVWPQMRDRILRALRLNLRGIQIVPCDPPVPTPTLHQDPDPLRRALLLLEARHQERVRLGLEPE